MPASPLVRLRDRHRSGVGVPGRRAKAIAAVAARGPTRPASVVSILLSLAIVVGAAVVPVSTTVGATIASGRPAAAERLGADDARHLLARTGFGGSAGEIAQFAGLTRDEAIDRLLATVRGTATIVPPAGLTAAGALPPPAASRDADERREDARRQREEALALRTWWITEMRATPAPLTERMTLFWHNHFVSSQQKVRLARLMYAQNATFRRYATGNFGTLLHAAAKEPAMLVYLDGVRNRKDAPNENFAREVMELFTLGEGHYTEQDVREAARAFTGWSIDRATGAFVFRPRLHDDGTKTIFGRTGRFDGDDVLDLILGQPAAARFIVAKLWRELVAPDPDPREVDRIADAFRASHYEIAVALRGILASPSFWAAENRGTLVKSPVELVVGTLRTLDIDREASAGDALALAAMGQNLFAPPNVRGWPGGERWINSSTLLVRKQFVDRVTRPTRPRPPPDAMAADDAVAAPGFAGRRPFDAATWLAAQPGNDVPTRLDAAQRLLLAIEPANGDVAEARSQRDPVLFVRAALLDPVYQLK
jgi:uncharacterized protein (DUF1800 family)